MLAHSGRGCLSVRRVQLDALVLETTQLLSLTLAKDVRLDLQLHGQGTTVQGDPTQLQQVIMNLVLNASEACDGKPGRVTLVTGLESVKRQQASSNLALDILEGHFAFLQVRDDGVGMSPQTQARMELE